MLSTAAPETKRDESLLGQEYCTVIDCPLKPERPPTLAKAFETGHVLFLALLLYALYYCSLKKSPTSAWVNGQDRLFLENAERVGFKEVLRFPCWCGKLPAPA